MACQVGSLGVWMRSSRPRAGPADRSVGQEPPGCIRPARRTDLGVCRKAVAPGGAKSWHGHCYAGGRAGKVFDLVGLSLIKQVSRAASFSGSFIGGSSAV